jgi:hypothetical protein
LELAGLLLLRELLRELLSRLLEVLLELLRHRSKLALP